MVRANSPREEDKHTLELKDEPNPDNEFAKEESNEPGKEGLPDSEPIPDPDGRPDTTIKVWNVSPVDQQHQGWFLTHHAKLPLHMVRIPYRGRRMALRLAQRTSHLHPVVRGREGYLGQ